VIPSLAHLRVAHRPNRGFGLWLPLFLLWIPALILWPLVELCLAIYCAVGRVNLWQLNRALWLLMQMGGTTVEAETPQAAVLIRLI